MMRQDHQQQIGMAQRQVLSQSARQLVQLVVAPPAEFADLVERRAAENPFLSVSRSFPRTGELRAGRPSPQASLFAHVLSEVPMLVRKPEDLPIAVRLAEGLDERGFLVEGLSEIAADLKVPVVRIETVLSLVQSIEPVGLFARLVTECLALQLRAMGQLDEAAVGLLCNLDGLAASGAKDFARRQGMDPGRVNRLIDLIARLSRNPAAAFGETETAAIPELQFERQAGEWSVRPILQSAPHLKLRHAAFAKALEEAPDADARSELRRKWRAACDLHQAASIRDTTVGDLGNQLLLHQRTGLDSSLSRLAPLTQREMAARLSVHESSVSRMVRNRFALVEGKVVPLSRFFERPLAAKDKDPRTRSIVLDALRELIATDPSASTMSDLALTRKLAGSGIEVTRRRLGKYRAILGVPSSYRRKATIGT
jgi:RNA polymerase sigma-54 factor